MADIQAVRTVKESWRELSEAEQRELAHDLGFPGVTDQSVLGRLYLALIAVLAILAILSGLAAFVLFGANKDTAGVFMTVVTTIVGGLLGLFAPSPIANNNGR